MKLRNHLHVRHKQQGEITAKHRLEYVVFRFSETILRILPGFLVDFMGIALGTILYPLAPSMRRVVWRNIMVAWGEHTDDASLVKLSKKIFRTNAANLLGSIRCGIIPYQNIRQHFELEGEGALIKALLEGKKGAIIALAHMGNWEILARMNEFLPREIQCGAMYRPLNNQLVNTLVKRRREESGTRLFAKKEGFIEAIQLLRDGGALGILADQHAGNSGELCPFFGRLTSCSPLPSLLQRRTGAAMFYASVVRTAPARWKVTLTPHTEDQVTTASIMRGIEKSLMLSPADGFWFHERWKLPHKKPLGLQNRRGEREAKTKAQQVLVILSEDPALRQESLGALRQLISQRPHLHFHLTHAVDLGISDRIFVIEPTQSLSSIIAHWENVYRLPLDMILILDRPRSMKGLQATVIAGYGTNKKLTHGIKQEPQLYDSSAWFRLLSRLGFITEEDQPAS